MSAQTDHDKIVELEKRLQALDQEFRPRIVKLEIVEPPVGTIVAFAGPLSKIPQNWRLCNGDPLSKNDYPQLWDKIENYWGGDGSPNFRLPDLRGVFLRGVDAGANKDRDRDKRVPSNPGKPKNEAGSLQADQMQTHIHNVTSTVPFPLYRTVPEKVDNDDQKEAIVNGNEGPGGEDPNAGGVTTTISEPVAFGTGGTPRIGSETRPVNAYVYWLIKVR